MTQSLQNRLLQMMPSHDLAQLRPHLHEVTLDYRMSLCEADQPIRDVYFPVTGVASLVTVMRNGFATEVGTIGNEGFVGIPIVLGDTVGPTNVYMQVPGVGLRLKANILKDLLERSTAARTLMLHHVHAFFNQVAQSAACNTAHKVEQRCCRWLLMTHDRMQSDNFPLTQEFLAMMLGVKRTSVSAVAQKLKALNLVQYGRGHATILDRAGLERHSCECYSVSKREFDRLLGPAKGLVQPRPAVLIFPRKNGQG
jgi:CRP-like cAMP-binding protein